MPLSAQFALDATITAQKADLTDLTAGDTLDVIVNVFGFDPSDTQVRWVFTAKVNPADSDSAPTTVQKLISPSEVLPSGIRAVPLSSMSMQGHFQLSQSDTALLVACTSFDVRVFITRGGLSYDRTVLRGNLSAAVSTTGVTVFFSGAGSFTPGNRQFAAIGTVAPLTPGNFASVFNALGGGTAGGTLRFLGVRGTARQHIKANGDPTLNSPGTNSPTGFWCDFWDDELLPGQGKHLRPSAGVNGGNGAPCLANGHLSGEGLEWPASVGFSMGTAETVSRSVFLANSGGLSNVLTDRGAGFMLGAFGNMKNGTYLFYVGETGNADKTYYSEDFGFGREALADFANSGFVDGLVSNTPTQQHMAMWCSTINGRGAPGTLWSQDWYLVGRDLVWYDSSINVNDGTYGPTPSSNTTAVRRVRLLKSGGNTSDQYGGVDCVYALAGRMNGAQHKLICDWAETQTWGSSMWNDTRSHLTNYLGDSLFVEDIQHLSRGNNGAAAIPSHAIVFLAQSGDFLEQRLYHLVEVFRDMDYSKRAATAGVCMCAAGEYVNDIVSDASAANCLARNLFQADAFRALDPQRMRVIISGETYANANTLVNGQTILNALLNGGLGQTAAVPAHADVFLDFVNLLPFTAYHFQDGDPAHQIPVFFDGSSHWTALAEEYLEAPVRNAIKAALGFDVSNDSNDLVPNVTNQTLTAGSPTFTVSFTVKNRLRTTLLGKTITLSSLDPSIASVNGAGLVTRLAVGRARIKAVSNDGALGIFVADCT